eukprot:3697812-Rhodomonas_salina.2
MPGYVVVVQRPPDTINIWAFFRPFSRDLWVRPARPLLVLRSSDAFAEFATQCPLLTKESTLP